MQKPRCLWKAARASTSRVYGRAIDKHQGHLGEFLTMLGNPNVDRVARRRDATRREILEAAWALIREDGWAGLTLRAVGARVGMRAPSLYTHFDSKLAIV